MGRSEVSTSVVKWSKGLRNRVSIIMKFYFFFHILLVLLCVIVYMVVCFVCFYLIAYIMYSYCYVCSLLGIVCFIVLFCVLFVCKCVPYCCHRTSTQLQLSNIYHIVTSYHIIHI